MRSSIRARLAAAAATVGLIFAGLTPSFAPVAAADPLVLRAGTDQDLQVLNPFNSILVVDFEVFTLNYDLLVNFGPDLEPAPGFAESWTVSDDGLTWTFKIREGMKWSDGTPATSEDARWSYQLALDADAASQASEDGYYLAAGYLEPYLLNAGVSAVSAPDPQTLVVETSFANQLILQAYFPILPKHVWSEYSMDDIAMYSETPFLNEPPVVGTGPYQAAEWKPGEFIRYVRNPNYWGPKGAADEVILLTFEDADTMVQALKTGQVDYVRGVQPAQFDALKTEKDIVAVEGISNGYSEIAFNTKGNTEGYGGSTSALTDPKFRSALGYAIDTAKLVETTLGGYGVPGDSVVPPFHTRWYDQPDNLRPFDIEEANRLLDEAGYARDGDGDRLDAEGNKIVLRVTWPDSEAEHETDAQLIQGWWEQLGIGVDAYVTEEGKLLEDLLPPVSDGPADFDIELWGWVGDPDPTSLLNVLRTEEIGNFSDSFWSNERYDELFLLQRAESDEAARKAQIKEMQQIAYDEAPYLIMYYDAELHAYRTDKFAGWKDQPTEGGTPLFGYGSGGYNVLTDATTATGIDSQLPLMLAGLGVALLIIVLALVVRRRRRPAATEEE
jgi:peptide/nickel transport system substrate-binding protein